MAQTVPPSIEPLRRVATRPVQAEFAGHGSIEFGGRSVVVIAGPCSIEGREHLLETAEIVREAGACFLRGGIYKMRTSAESFQGLGSSAFSFVADVKRAVAMPLVSEIVDPRQIGDMIDAVEMFQVGSRSMYNYALLRELGQTNKPVLLKRGFSATIDEWIKAADYVARGGNERVILCERGIRSFETVTRNTLDLNAVAYVKAHAPWPVVVDPSHGTGRPELIAPMSMASVAAGADGLIIEVHPRPKEAKSDGFQALDANAFRATTEAVSRVANAIGRPLAQPFARPGESALPNRSADRGAAAAGGPL